MEDFAQPIGWWPEDSASEQGVLAWDGQTAWDNNVLWS